MLLQGVWLHHSSLLSIVSHLKDPRVHYQMTHAVRNQRKHLLFKFSSQPSQACRVLCVFQTCAGSYLIIKIPSVWQVRGGSVRGRETEAWSISLSRCTLFHCSGLPPSPFSGPLVGVVTALRAARVIPGGKIASCMLIRLWGSACHCHLDQTRVGLRF